MAICYADPSPTFKPTRRIISAITNSNPATVTTVLDHEYVDGTIVRIYVPKADGMQQIDKMTGSITVTGAKTFTVDIDTTNFDTFSIPVGVSRHVVTCAYVIPIGENNNTLSAATRNVL